MARVNISKTIKAPKEVSYTNYKAVSELPEGYTEQYPVSKLEAGHSMFIAGVTPYELRHDIYPAANRLGYEVTARQEETRNGTFGTRVWRTA